jgi:hypothetical protein
MQKSFQQQPKEKWKKFISSQQQSTIDDFFDSRTHDKIDEGYTYKRNLSFIIDINHISLPIDVLNVENANFFYKALLDTHIVTFSWLILRLVFYKDPNGSANKKL